MNITEDKERLISRYLNDTCSKEDKKQLQEWINQSKENKQHFLRLKDLWDAGLKKEDQSDRALTYFYKNQANKFTSLSKKIVFWRWASGIAAILILGLVFAILNYPTFNPDNNLVSYSVPLGSKSQIVLPDGTIVDLNSGSKLQYPSNFNAKNRNVSLSGEAFFNVTSDKLNPFVVKTSDFDITVTGTKFNVCSYYDNNFSSTALLEGKITLTASNIKPLELKPGEKVELDRIIKKLSYVPVDENAETAWKNGRFIFNKIAFPDLIKRLERWYDVKLNYNNEEFNSLLYSGCFKNQETIWQVLDALKLTSPIDYTRINFREFNLIFSPM